MKRTLYIFVLLFLSVAVMAEESDKNALRIVNQTIDKMKSNAVLVDFSMNYTAATHETNQVEFGNSVIYGNQFYFKMSGIETFYNGKSQWVYVADINEVTITEPTVSELKDVNPMALIQYSMTNHRVAFDEAVGNEKYWFINMYPLDKKKAEYFKVALQISKKSYYPHRITVYQKNGDKIIFDWMTIKILTNPNLDRFKFNKANYPKVVVNDLR